MTVFGFSNYEGFFNQVLKEHASDRGYRTKLANAAKVHPSYITRIASGSAAMTPDQAAALAEFWGLDGDEREYFLWLVLKGRSGDPSMRQMADRILERLKQSHEELGNSLAADKVSPSAENEYYMNWLYSAVHMLGTLRTVQTIEQVSKRLGVSSALAKGAVAALVKLDLAQWKDAKTFKATKRNIHLSNRSWMSSLQHRNWRIFSLEKLGRPSETDFRYTGVHSLSKADLEKLRQIVRDFLVQADQLVRPSPEETVCVLCLDLMEL